jgi:hypothetical protein
MFLFTRCSRPGIAKGGNLGERLERTGAMRSRRRSERAATETGTETDAGTRPSPTAILALLIATFIL